MNKHRVAIFVGDSAGLDFLNSVATPLDTTIDWIDDGEGLLDWIDQARLAPASALESARSEALPGELDRIAGQARSLREWMRGFVLKHKGTPLSRQALEELEPLNKLLQRDEAFSQIVGEQSGGAESLTLMQMRRWTTPETLLIPIGEALAQLVCTEDFSHVKVCEGATCTLIFADHTRGHVRRWCSMAICGNRAKQSAHRKRSK